jgi:hypothetical protein
MIQLLDDIYSEIARLGGRSRYKSDVVIYINRASYHEITDLIVSDSMTERHIAEELLRHKTLFGCKTYCVMDQEHPPFKLLTGR